MAHKVLVTGAAGYVGGTIVTSLLEKESRLFKKEQIHIVVRSDEQANAFGELGINVLRFDLKDEKAVIEGIAKHDINVVVHTASSIDPKMAESLIAALGKRKEATGNNAYFIQTSGLTAFYSATGWPPEDTKDTDQVFEMEKKLADSFPARKTDIFVTDLAEKSGVTSFLVIPPNVHGKGTGRYNQLSIVVPPHVSASIAKKRVHKFAENIKLSFVHVSDLANLFILILENIVQGNDIPSGKQGYYFAIAHRVLGWDMMEHLSIVLKARGLVEDDTVQIWPNDVVAAEALGVPEMFVQVLYNSDDRVIAENAYNIGWQPVWNRIKFLQNMDEEVKDVLELGKSKGSLMASLSALAG